MSERGTEMKTEPSVDRERDVTQPLVTPGMAGTATAKREQVPDRIDRERGALDYQSSAGSQPEEDLTPLFDQAALETFRSSWGAIQTGFVDDPAGAVKQADELVATVMKRLAEVFSGERVNLEQAWEKSEPVSTEDLRVALRRYRAFFDRLLSV